MPRRRAWNGSPPETPDDARRRLLDTAREVVERVGVSKASLSDVAESAGVTRQTVYRYFESTEDLFNSAAALASGGFYERMRERTADAETLPARMVESLVHSIIHIPEDPHLGALSTGGYFTVDMALSLSMVQEEMVRLAGGAAPMCRRDMDELAELLLRLLQSFLQDPDRRRSEEELRAFLLRWVGAMIESRLD